MNAPWAQNEFAMALVNRARPVPEETTSWTAPRPLKRFNVYRGNVDDHFPWSGCGLNRSPDRQAASAARCTLALVMARVL